MSSPIKHAILIGLFLVVLIPANADIVYQSDCSSKTGWSGVGLDRVAVNRGFFDLNGTTADPNISISTAQSFGPASYRLSFDGIKNTIPWNGAAYLQIGLGDSLAIRITTYGDASCLVYNGATYSLPRGSVGNNGNIKLEIEYYPSTHRVVVRQRAGTLKDTTGAYLAACYTVLLDQTFPAAIAGSNSIKIFGATNYNGGYGVGNATIAGVIYTNCGSTIDSIKLETIPDIAIPSSPEGGSWSGEHYRGMNVYGSLTQEDFADLRQNGCNLIRYQIQEANFLDDGAGGATFQPATWNAINDLLAGVAQCNANELLSALPPLKVVLDVHSGGKLFPGTMVQSSWGSASNRYKLASLWVAIAASYLNNADIAAYEILNEPAPPRTSEGYRALNEIMQQVTDAIRSVDGNRTIIASGPEYSRPQLMDKIIPTKDANTVYTFHMYEPMEFTHQGTGLDRDHNDPNYASVNHPTYPSAIPLGWSSPYADTLVDRAFVIATMAKVVAFQQTYGKRIWVGEFSARRSAGYDNISTFVKNGNGVWSAYAWLKDVVEYMEEKQWDWIYHCYRPDRFGDYTWSVEHASDAIGAVDLSSYNRIVSDRLQLMRSYFDAWFVDSCSSLSSWTGSQIARVNTAGGCFTLTGAGSQPAITLTTSGQFDTTNLEYARISANNIKQAINLSSAYLQVGLDQSGADNLAVRVTYWGDNSKFYYNGAVYSFSLDARPVGCYGNVSLIIEYFNMTSTGVPGGRVKITQLSGSFKKPSNGTTYNNSYNNGYGTVVVDRDFPNAPLASGLQRLKLSSPAGNYGTGSTIDNVVLGGH